MTEFITTEAAGRAFPGFEEKTRPLPALDPAAAAFLARGTAVVEGIRSLATRLRVIENERPLHAIGLVSTIAEEGKTLIALGLASALAREGGRRVLLIEADLRQRRIRNYLGINPEPGLAEWLERGDRRVPVLRLLPGEFGLLPAGVVPCAPELLGSPRMATLVEAARQQFDVVMLDCAPLAPVADSLAVQDLVDGFLFVVRARHCPRASVVRARNLLRADKIIGTVLNDEHLLLPTQDSYGYHYGRGAYSPYGRYDTLYVAEEPPRGPAPVAAKPVAAPRSAVGSVGLGPSLRESAPAGPGITIAPDAGEAPRRRKVVAVAVVLGLVVAAAAAGVLLGRARPAPVTPATVPPTTLGAETTAALERVKQLEERLQGLEAEKAAAAAQAAEEARKKVEAQAASRGKPVDPAVVARAQEEARRQAQADAERRLREEQDRLQAEQRAAQQRLEEERRRTAEASRNDDPPAAPVPSTTLAAVAVPPPDSVTPAPPPAASTPAPAPVTAAPAPAIAAGTLVALADPGVIAPVPERTPRPSYPTLALRQKLEGTIQLNVLVDERGYVIETRVVRGVSGNWGLNEAAVASMKDRRYRPATKDGVAVKVWLPVRVEFRLP